MIYNNLLQLVGKTPLLNLNGLKQHLGLKANIVAKLEYFNPAGSVKDRIALSMVENAENLGLINKDTILIEATSGNTGIGLAFVCAIKKYKLILCMPETMSIERRKLFKAYGATLVLTNGKDGMKGAIEKSKELNFENTNSIILSQFDNLSNPKTHKETTGPEIWNDLNGNIDFFVASVGTGGTITGAGEYLKNKNPNINIVAIEPNDSAVLSGQNSGSHQIQGIGAGFIPKILNTNIYNEIIRVTNKDAFETSSLIAKTDGLLVGISSGAALYGAIDLAKSPQNENKNIVVILPDTGERYLSTSLYED